jgi:CrcB protein
MSLYAALAVFCGAGLGALLRWWLNITLTPIFPTIPLGTLTANLIGGLLVGIATAFFSHSSSVSPEIRLLVITGFMGGLTTFSTFSVEVMTLLGRTEYLWALVAASAHLFGALGMTALGMMMVNALYVRG